MNRSKSLFVLVFALISIVFAIFEFGVLPTDLIVPSGEASYAINLLSIITAVGGCFILLYWFRFGWIRRYAEQSNGRKLATANNIRLWTWFILMLINIVLYYEAHFTANPKYGILILFVAGVFCWPTERK